MESLTPKLNVNSQEYQDMNNTPGFKLGQLKSHIQELEDGEDPDNKLPELRKEFEELQASLN